MKKVKSFLGGLVAVVILLISLTFTGCKEDPIIPEGGLATVSFKPVLSGTTDLVPWLQPRLKSFGEFEHKYANHIVRIWRQGIALEDEWYGDIPITNDIMTQDIPITIIPGIYAAEVIPIDQNAILNGMQFFNTGGIPYALSTEFPFSNTGVQNYAVYYTRVPVSFTIVPGANTVTLDCITDQACMLLNVEDAIANLFVPGADASRVQLWTSYKEHAGVPTMTNLRSALDGELAVNPTVSHGVNTILSTDNPLMVLHTLISDATADESTNLYWDITSSSYYAYFIPGRKTDMWNNDIVSFERSFYNYSTGLPEPFTLFGDIISGPGITNTHSFLAFRPDDSWSELIPTVWLRDYTTYNSSLLTPNMVVRVSLSSGLTITVNQEDWFGTFMGL